MKVLVTLAPPFREPYGSGRPLNSYVEVVEKSAPESWKLIVPDRCTEEKLSELVKGADVILGSSISRKVVESAQQLKIIQAIGAGVDKIDVGAAAEKGILVCNARGFNASPLAEHAFALILALTKHIVSHDTALRNGVWRPLPSLLLEGKTIGIIGLGSSGIEVAVRARAFDMRIIASKRHPSNELKARLGLDFLGSGQDLDYMLSESDVVVLCVPLTLKTKGLIGEKEILLMKRNALLINISRGAVIDEKALVQALQRGQIGGAGLDVFTKEPLDPDNPLLNLPNVVLTPHVGGGRPNADSQEWLTRVDFCIRNITKALSGKIPDNLVVEAPED